MKNAYVLEHHLGDDGTVDVGMILADVSQKRFDELERKGLVREASADEVKAGYQPTIAEDESGGELAGDEKQAEKPANKKAAEPANKAN